MHQTFIEREEVVQTLRNLHAYLVVFVQGVRRLDGDSESTGDYSVAIEKWCVAIGVLVLQ